MDDFRVHDLLDDVDDFFNDFVRTVLHHGWLQKVKEVRKNNIGKYFAGIGDHVKKEGEEKECDAENGVEEYRDRGPKNRCWHGFRREKFSSEKVAPDEPMVEFWNRI